MNLSVYESGIICHMKKTCFRNIWQWEKWGFGDLDNILKAIKSYDKYAVNTYRFFLCDNKALAVAELGHEALVS